MTRKEIVLEVLTRAYSSCGEGITASALFDFINTWIDAEDYGPIGWPPNADAVRYYLNVLAREGAVTRVEGRPLRYRPAGLDNFTEQATGGPWTGTAENQFVVLPKRRTGLRKFLDLLLHRS
jgi:hypothetical protein